MLLCSIVLRCSSKLMFSICNSIFYWVHLFFGTFRILLSSFLVLQIFLFSGRNINYLQPFDFLSRFCRSCSAPAVAQPDRLPHLRPVPAVPKTPPSAAVLHPSSSLWVAGLAAGSGEHGRVHPEEPALIWVPRYGHFGFSCSVLKSVWVRVLETETLSGHQGPAAWGTGGWLLP